MPQVQVALREMSRGKTIRVNDVMSYIVTMGDAQTQGLPAPKRAYHPHDVLKANSGLQPDIEYYLLKQILPPIERLCAPIPGTDSVRLAECLGLDTKKYQIHATGSGKNGGGMQNNSNSEIFPLESQIPESIRFKDATPLALRCNACCAHTHFGGLSSTPAICTPTGLVCGNSSCQRPFSLPTIIAQVESHLRTHTCRYYEGWLVCDDTSCGLRTRQISVYGHRCLGPGGRAEGCLGRMNFEYGAKQLYNQLLYVAGLFDVDKAKEAVKRGTASNAAAADRVAVDEELRQRVLVLAEGNREAFSVVADVVQAHLRKCGRLWVDMGALFAVV